MVVKLTVINAHPLSDTLLENNPSQQVVCSVDSLTTLYTSMKEIDNRNILSWITLGLKKGDPCPSPSLATMGIQPPRGGQVPRTLKSRGAMAPAQVYGSGARAQEQKFNGAPTSAPPLLLI